MSKQQENDSGMPAMRKVEKTPPVSRRAFLRGSGLASIGITVMSGSTLLANPTGALAQQFKVLGPDTAKVMLRMARDIFPHDRLGDKYYLRAIEPFEPAARKDPKLKKLLTDGVSLLNATSTELHGKPYLDVMQEADRVAVLQSIEATPFFQKVRGDLVTGIYDNKEIFPFFGYEGSSWEKGGYINRGFNDIDWL